MPKRSQRAAVAERTQQRLADQSQKRKARQQHRQAPQAAGQPQARPERATQANVAQDTPPRVHADLVTVAFRGPLAEKTRTLARQCQLSLAKLMQDALLLYEQKVGAGYQAGSLLSAWKAEQAPAQE